MINQDTTTQFYAKNQIVLTLTYEVSYHESGDLNHYIGYTENSFDGIVWSFYIFDGIIADSDFFSPDYSPGNCLVSPCPTSCSPAIKENGINYCISSYSVNSCLPCSTGCLETKCFSCLNCNPNSCIIEYDNPKCICSKKLSVCSCLSNEYLDQSDQICKSCYPECQTCNSTIKCLTCKDQNSEVHNTIGCICKTRYYNTSALITSGLCLECYSDCSSCTKALICSTCISSNSNPHISIGCVCNKYYYNITALYTADACKLCYNECQSCSNDINCNECISLNAIPHLNVGCICNDGYYNTTSLTLASSCIRCHENCKKCSEKYSKDF